MKVIIYFTNNNNNNKSSEIINYENLHTELVRKHGRQFIGCIHYHCERGPTQASPAVVTAAVIVAGIVVVRTGPMEEEKVSCHHKTTDKYIPLVLI